MGQNFSWIEQVGHGLSNNKEDDNEQETSEMQFEDFALKTNVLAFASRSKAKAKPQRRISASSSTKTVLIGKRFGPMLNQENIQSPIMKCRRN